MAESLQDWNGPVLIAFLIRSTLTSCFLHRAVELTPRHLSVLPQVDRVVLRVVDRRPLVVKVHLKVVHSLLRVCGEILHDGNTESNTITKHSSRLFSFGTSHGVPHSSPAKHWLRVCLLGLILMCRCANENLNWRQYKVYRSSVFEFSCIHLYAVIPILLYSYTKNIKPTPKSIQSLKRFWVLRCTRGSMWL